MSTSSILLGKGKLTVIQKDGGGWESILSWGAIVAAVSAIAIFLAGIGKGLWGIGRWLEKFALMPGSIAAILSSIELLRARDGLLAGETGVEMIWMGPDGLILPERIDAITRLTEDLFNLDEADFYRTGWSHQISIRGGTHEDFEEWFDRALQDGERDQVRVTISRGSEEPLDRVMQFRPIRYGNGPVLGVALIFRNIERWEGSR